jgi:integrase
MKPVSAQTKAARGSVGIEVFRDKLRLRLPRQIFGGVQKYVSTGLENTPENGKRAQSKAWQIEEDIATGNFDSTLDRYRPQSHLAIVKTIVKPVETPKLTDLWEQYTDHKSKTLQATTILTTYKRVKNHIAELPTKDLKEAIAIRNYLLTTKSNDTAKRVITHLSACCDWAKQCYLISENPFIGMAEKIKLVKNFESDKIEPFTPEERDAIIEAFELNSHYKYYTPFVKFLFLTGCRTGEAVALKWKHVNKDCRQITFCESVNTQFKVRQDTKNHRSRKFPCNSRLQALLQSIKPEDCNPENLVFPSTTGKEIDAGDFLNRAWKGYKNHRGNQTEGIVTRLVREGKLSHYRCLYNTRHTFITLALENGLDAKDVARLVGNSPEILYKHYAGSNVNKLQVPEF